MFRFIIRAPSGHIMEHNMSSDIVTLGREPGNDIVLNAPSVSRRHARIYVWEGRCCIEDLGSSNGVYVNGHKIKEAVAIDPSSHIDVGGFDITLSDGKTRSMPPEKPATSQQSPAAIPQVGGPLLIGLTEPVAGKTFLLPAFGEAIVGRGEGCTVIVHHNSISRNHARIIIGQSGITVQDLGSSNGTFVDGFKVPHKQVVPGQKLRFGKVEFKLDVPGARVKAGGGSLAISQKELLKYGFIFFMLIVIALVLLYILLNPDMFEKAKLEGEAGAVSMSLSSSAVDAGDV
jgi:pSer/pThr/pTyr-binding forkhead associated (FHA) protein